MTAKVISVYLMISCFFLIASGDSELKITAKEYDAFQGVDPATHCKNLEDLKNECNKLGKLHKFTDGKKPFTKGYPNCVDGAEIVVQKDEHSSETVIKHGTLINCSWRSDLYFIIGKGQLKNHFMQYYTNDAQQACPHKDLPYP